MHFYPFRDFEDRSARSTGCNGASRILSGVLIKLNYVSKRTTFLSLANL